MMSDQTALDLRTQGIGSYLHAIMAIDAFMQAIHDDCQSALEAHLRDLEAATELRFSKKDMTKYSEPSKNRTNTKLWPGQWATIGVELEESKQDKIWSWTLEFIGNMQRQSLRLIFTPAFTLKILQSLTGCIPGYGLTVMRGSS